MRHWITSFRFVDDGTQYKDFAAIRKARRFIAEFPYRGAETDDLRLIARAIFDTIGTMIDRSKKIMARFYVTVAGEAPVRTWLLKLSKADRRIVGKDIQKVEFGWPIGMPYCRALGHGLWEVRSNLPGNRIVRVIFSIVGGEMALLHGFEKKTQKTPPQDIELALKRKRDIEG